MNYLELVQRLGREAGASGSIVTTHGATGETKRLCDWINSAWSDIQTMHQDWLWLRKSVSFTTVAGQATYSMPADIEITDFGMWARDTFRNYPTATGTNGEVFMDYVDYESWRNSYQYGALRNTRSRPMVITITPDKSIGLGPTPEDGYTITGDYFSAPTDLVLDADIPAMPTQFHMAIVWRGLMLYGGYEGAVDAYQRGEVEYARIMQRLAIDRLPQVVFGGPLA